MNKINDMQDEFDRLLKERQDKSQSPVKVSSSSPVKTSNTSKQKFIKETMAIPIGETSNPLMYEQLSTMKDGQIDPGDFRRVMDMVYGGNKPKKHKSPTKRLMQQKDAAWKHKEFLKNNRINYLKKNESD